MKFKQNKTYKYTKIAKDKSTEAYVDLTAITITKELVAYWLTIKNRKRSIISEKVNLERKDTFFVPPILPCCYIWDSCIRGTYV